MVHPVVKTHPVTGRKVLFVNPGYTVEVNELSRSESTGLLRMLFRTEVSDAHCGMRAFTKDAYRRMQLQTTGMEFASEMVIKAVLGKLRIAQIPITLYPDGRSRPPHLRCVPTGASS